MSGLLGRWTRVWAYNFLATLFVVVTAKYILVWHDLMRPTAELNALELIPLSFLLLGWDIVAAAGFALVVALLCLPWIIRGQSDPGRPAVLATSAFLQFVHGAGVGIGLFVALFVGTPPNKEGFDLAFMAGVAQPDDGLSGIWSSVLHYLTPATISAIAFLCVLGAVVALLAPRIAARLQGYPGWLVAGVSAVYAATTIVLVPALARGDIGGLRLNTHELERSHTVEFVGSYLEAWLCAPGPAPRPDGDAFRFDLRSPFPPAEDAQPPLAGAEVRRTNVVVVLLESIAESYIREEPSPMPFLASIGTPEGPPGVALARHYTTWSQTTKAFFSIFCSELPYPSHLPISFVNPAIPCRSLPEELHARGYATALVTSADLGYERMWAFFEHRDFDRVLHMRNMPDRERFWRNSWGVDESLTIRNLLEVIDSFGDQPYFAVYGTGVPHNPYLCSREHEENPLDDDRARYLRALGYMDERIRELVDGLAGRGLAENTLLVIITDHGEAFHQHPASLSHGMKVYDEMTRVPVVFLGPQVAGLRRVVQQTTSHVDLAPTILSLLGMEAPCTMKGRDLRRSAEPRVAILGGRPPGAQHGLVDGDWKYVLHENGFEELFDLARDPTEKNDLYASFPERATAYRRIVDDWRAHAAYLIENYASVQAEAGCR